MNRSLFAPLAALLLAPLAACETTVDVDVPPHTPRLALNYTLSSQAPDPDYQAFFRSRQLFVSTSQAVLDTRQLNGRADATVQLLDAASGQVVEEFRPDNFSPNGDRGYYEPVRNFAGVPGGRYTLRASAPDVAPVEATLSLPARPVVETASYAVRPPANPQQPGGARYRGRLAFSVVDNGATADYYLAYARVLDAQGRFWGAVSVENRDNGGLDVQLDRLGLSDGFSYGTVRPYADQNGGNGRRLNVAADVVLSQSVFGGGPNQPAPAFVEVVVSGITPDTYRFYQSLQRYYDTDGNPFAEPAPLHSNVQGGYGLFGGAADAVVRIPL